VICPAKQLTVNATTVLARVIQMLGAAEPKALPITVLIGLANQRGVHHFSLVHGILI